MLRREYAKAARQVALVSEVTGSHSTYTEREADRQTDEETDRKGVHKRQRETQRKTETGEPHGGREETRPVSRRAALTSPRRACTCFRLLPRMWSLLRGVLLGPCLSSRLSMGTAARGTAVHGRPALAE